MSDADSLKVAFTRPSLGQEEENAEFIENSGAGIWVKDSDNIETILLNIFNNPDKLENMKSKARLIAKKNSTQNIVEILLG